MESQKKIDEKPFVNPFQLTDHIFPEESVESYILGRHGGDDNKLNASKGSNNKAPILSNKHKKKSEKKLKKKAFKRKFFNLPTIMQT